MKNLTLPLALSALLITLHAVFSDNRPLDLLLIGLSFVLLMSTYSRLRVSASKVPVGLVLLLLLFVSLCVLDAVYYVAAVFTGNGINQQAMDHLSVDSLKAGFNGWFDYLYGLLAIPFIFIVGFVVCVGRAKRTQVSFRWGRFGLGVCMGLFALLVHPASYDLIKHQAKAKIYRGVDAGLMKQYQRGQISESQIESAIQSVSPQKNIVLIYLESYERAVLDQSKFPNLANNLSRFEQEGQTFGQFNQLMGTSHTIAGLVASQCGVPYAVTGGSGNARNNGGGNYFMPHIQCLADITRKLGYHNVYFQGGHLDFTRKRAFFNEHGYDEVKGYDEPWTNIPQENRRAWGFHDDLLFEFASQRIDELMQAKKQNPFLFSMLTLDTHDAGSGTRSMSKTCYQRGFNHYRDRREHVIQDQLLCSDALVGQFVDGLRKKYADDLTIFIVSDHLPHSISTLPSLKGTENRELIFVKVNGAKMEAPSRVFSHFDVGATILDYITGGKMTSLGMGVSTASTDPTLIERFGVQQANKKIYRSLNSLAQLYWQYPSLKDNPLEIDLEQNVVRIAQATFPIPIAFQIDQQHEIRAYFSSKIPSLLKTSNLTQGLIYIEKCGELADFQGNNHPPDEWCFLAGNLGAESMYIDRVADNDGFEFSKLKPYFESKFSQRRLQARLYEQKPEHIDQVETSASSAIAPIAEAVFTTGANPGERMVTNFWNQSKFNKFWGFENHDAAQHAGFYLYRILGGNVKLVHVWKTCDGQDEPQLQHLLEASAAEEFVLMTGKHGLQCDSVNNAFSGTPFYEDLATLEKNAGFVGYLDRADNRYEVVKGRHGQTIELRLIDQAIFQQQPQ